MQICDSQASHLTLDVIYVNRAKIPNNIKTKNLFLYLPAVLRLRRKHGRCDSDNLSLPSTDDDDVKSDERKKKNINTNFSSSSDDSEDSQEPYSMGNFPVEARTCIVCHRVGCKDEHIKRKPRTLFINPEEILEGSYIFIEEVDDFVGGGDGPKVVLSAEPSPINGHDKAAGDEDVDVYQDKLMELKEQLAIEYAESEDDCYREDVLSFAEDIKDLCDSKSNDIINVSSDSSIEEYSLEEMNTCLPEVFSQIDKLYRDVVNEEAVLNVRTRKSVEWDDYMEGSFLSQMLSQWNFGVDFMKWSIEDYFEGSFISLQLSQWDFGVDFGENFVVFCGYFKGFIDFYWFLEITLNVACKDSRLLTVDFRTE